MVSARIVILVGLVFLVVAYESGWLYLSVVGYGVTAGDMSGNVGPYLLHGYTRDNLTIDSEVWVVLVPQLVSNGAIVAAEIALPVSFVLAVISLFLRWKLMLPAGIVAILCALLWIWGIGLIGPAVNGQLDAWLVYHTEAASSSIYPLIGPYIMAFGGMILIAGYVLTKAGKLEIPSTD